MPGHRGIFLLGQSMSVCVCVGGGGRRKVGWDKGDGISKLQLENFPASEETLKSHPPSDFINTHTAPVLCRFHKTCRDTFGFCPKFTDVFFFLSGCSSCDYLETWVLCLCMFVNVFPLTLHCAAAAPGTVPVDQVSLCLCLLL